MRGQNETSNKQFVLDVCDESPYFFSEWRGGAWCELIVAHLVSGEEFTEDARMSDGVNKRLAELCELFKRTSVSWDIRLGVSGA